MKKNELILSVRDLNIKFNLRGKILHAIRIPGFFMKKRERSGTFLRFVVEC